MRDGVRDGSVDRFFRGLAADADQEARAGVGAGAGAGAMGDAHWHSKDQRIDEALRNRQREPRRKSPPPDTEAEAAAEATAAALAAAPSPRHARTDTLGGDAAGLSLPNAGASAAEAAPVALSPRRKNSTWV